METFTKAKEFVHNPFYHAQRKESLDRLDMKTIDVPIIQLIEGLLNLPYCFTLQSCYGHFLYDKQRNQNNTEPLPNSDSIIHVEYRIAYIALCIENSDSGRKIIDQLQEIPVIDPEYIQFGCAEWFWERQCNSYVLQVESQRYKTKDKINIEYQEALHIEKIRNEFFNKLDKVIKSGKRNLS